MGIKGFQGTSLLDYPGRIAALVFYGGCNLSCAYCHNPDLVLNHKELPDMPDEQLFDELKRRSKLIEGVVVSGGEPTLQKGLVTLCAKIKDLGLLVKLDTNGLNPKMLELVLNNGLADFVAMDLKTSPSRYVELHTGEVPYPHLKRSVEAIKSSGVEHEIRTTVAPGFVTMQDIPAMGELVAGADAWAFQQFVGAQTLDPSIAEKVAPSKHELLKLVEAAKEYIPNSFTRGA